MYLGLLYLSRLFRSRWGPIIPCYLRLMTRVHLRIMGRHTSPTRRVRPGRQSALRPAAPQGTRGQSPHPCHPTPALRAGKVAHGATRGMTPKQACPQPDGLGRNLRSKTRWFTGFCNSHQVSHFATFFIDARAKISVVESRKDSL